MTFVKAPSRQLFFIVGALWMDDRFGAARIETRMADEAGNGDGGTMRLTETLRYQCGCVFLRIGGVGNSNFGSLCGGYRRNGDMNWYGIGDGDGRIRKGDSEGSGAEPRVDSDGRHGCLMSRRAS